MRTPSRIAARTLAIASVLGCSRELPRPPPPRDAGSASTTALSRAACAFGAGDLAATTLADMQPLGAAIPIDHIVLVMQENRSFDHYFSSLTVAGQTVDGASPTATNPDPTQPGQTVSRFHQTLGCFPDPAEGWDALHYDLGDGGLQGFTAQNADSSDPQGLRALGYYDGSDLPFYYSLAQGFAISDRHFASVLTNTWPNRLTYMAGTSFGLIGDGILPPSANASGVPYPNVFSELDTAGVDWRFYAESAEPTVCLFLATCVDDSAHLTSLQQFFADADAGNLPPVAWVEGDDFTGGDRDDEDPPADPQPGEALVESIVRALMASPDWPSTALFVTWDEPGGLYDHVDPPAACVPDDFPPQVPDGGFVAAFNQLGLRVPLFVVSPYAKRGYVSHQVTDHASILRFVEARFGLPAMTHRDANAVPPFDMFDFSQMDPALPSLAPSVINPTWDSTCATQYP